MEGNNLKRILHSSRRESLFIRVKSTGNKLNFIVGTIITNPY